MKPSLAFFIILKKHMHMVENYSNRTIDQWKSNLPLALNLQSHTSDNHSNCFLFTFQNTFIHIRIPNLVWPKLYTLYVPCFFKLNSLLLVPCQHINIYFIFWIAITDYFIVQMDCNLFSQSPIAKHVGFLFNYKWSLHIFDVEERNKK